jgi:protein TonB
MALRLFTLLVSLGVHLAAALFMLVPAGGHAIEEGAGQDIMVVEQGIALEGVAKLGEDEVTVDEVDVQPTEMAMAVPEQVMPVEQDDVPVEDTPEEVKPVEQDTILSSDQGPEQDTAWTDPEKVEEIKPEELTEPVQKVVEEKKPEEVKEVTEKKPDELPQPLPPQIAALEQEAVIAQHESSGAEKKGGSTTAQRAYLGKLRTHLEQNKVNPRTQIVGTALVQFTVDAEGAVTSRKIVKSSGSEPLDEAALASIDRASPFPPIPKDVGRRTMQVSVPFKFTVR